MTPTPDPAAVLERIARDPGHGGGVLGEDEIAAALAGAGALRAGAVLREALEDALAFVESERRVCSNSALGRIIDLSEQIEAALALPVPTPGAEWRGIATAPRNGDPIWVTRDAEVVLVRWMASLEEGDGQWIIARKVGRDAYAVIYRDPTHWCPANVPAPPLPGAPA